MSAFLPLATSKKGLLLSPSAEAVRRARVPAYFVAGLMFLIPLTEIAVSAWPYLIHDPAWRIGLITVSASVSTGILLALLITYLVAVFADERKTILLVGFVGALMVLFCIGAAGAFMLDALQMRAALRPGLQDRYNLQSGWALAKICLAAIGSAVLSVSAFRTAGAARRAPDRRGAKAPSGVLMTSSSTSVVSGQAP